MVGFVRGFGVDESTQRDCCMTEFATIAVRVNDICSVPSDCVPTTTRTSTMCGANNMNNCGVDEVIEEPSIMNSSPSFESVPVDPVRTSTPQTIPQPLTLSGNDVMGYEQRGQQPHRSLSCGPPEHQLLESDSRTSRGSSIVSHHDPQHHRCVSKSLSPRPRHRQEQQQSVLPCMIDDYPSTIVTMQPEADGSVPNRMSRQFSPLLSTEEIYATDDRNFYGLYRHIRATLDYTYHKNYTKERQRLQDEIITKFLSEAIVVDHRDGSRCSIPNNPWIVFTAGAFGAGKGYTLHQLVQKGRFPLLAFVQVNPDMLRRYLPEFYVYVQQNPEYAGHLSNKEAGYMAEILTLAGLRRGQNVIVDGSLRCAEWYRTYFNQLRNEFPNLRIAILHITAPRESVFQRAAERALHTHRIVPRELLVEALDQVPQSVAELAPLVDYHVEIHNVTGAPDLELRSPLGRENENWQSFTAQWTQTCKWVPKGQRRLIEMSKQMEQTLIHASET